MFTDQIGKEHSVDCNFDIKLYFFNYLSMTVSFGIVFIKVENIQMRYLIPCKGMSNKL